MLKLNEFTSKKQDNKLLQVNYSKALADDDFKKMVDSLEISTDSKMKYTSRLIEAVKEHKNCQKCKSLLACKNSIPGCALSV